MHNVPVAFGAPTARTANVWARPVASISTLLLTTGSLLLPGLRSDTGDGQVM
jgi:hypothetical protein